MNRRILKKAGFWFFLIARRWSVITKGQKKTVILMMAMLSPLMIAAALAPQWLLGVEPFFNFETALIGHYASSLIVLAAVEYASRDPFIGRG